MNLTELQTIFEINSNSPSGLIFKTRRGNRKAGTVAGTLHHTGYYVLKINKKHCQSHRLIWALYYKIELNLVPEFLDHIDRNRSNNNISNLRACSRVENNKNKGAYKNNTSGITGVHWHKQHQKWYARIGIGSGKKKDLGLFDNIEEAKASYLEAAKLLGYLKGD